MHRRKLHHGHTPSSKSRRDDTTKDRHTNALQHLEQKQADAHIYIATTPKVVGYAIAHPNKNWLHNKITNSYTGENQINNTLKNPFLYYQRLATKKDQPRVQIAKALSEHVEQQATNQGLQHSLGDLALNPPNIAALNFHHQQGYRIIASYQHKDTLWGIIHKTLP